VGLTHAVGVPVFRGVLGIGWAPREHDMDHDGVRDDVDGCPEIPEDKDGFEDSDGCPEIDNDDDGIIDREDACRDVKGVESQDPKKNGCPLDDSDGDGVEDKIDACPKEKGVATNDPKTTGCPTKDRDHDGIPDALDKCPTQPEDKDGFQDDDGCPDPDNDSDGILDASDKCPDAAEDMDGFQDDDGCPDPDNDSDNVLDAYDRCPDTPAGTEVDSRGCPIVRAAPAPAPAVPQPEEIKGDLILDGVNFLSGSADLTPASLEILKKVAESLRSWPDVTIEIRGHTDDAGPAETNRDLSQRRSLSVRDYLIRLGISSNRLSAVGYGEDYPIADNRTPNGRAVNRRVEVHRMER